VAVTDDVDALVAQLKLTQADRKAAEARVAELEGIELDIRESRDQVERLKATWGEWSTLLGAHDAPLPDGTFGPALARSILRKILVSPIVVTPTIEPVAPVAWSKLSADAEGVSTGHATATWVTSWHFRGISRFDNVIQGGLSKGEVTVEAPAWDSPSFRDCIGIDAFYNGPHPISGGSDGVVSHDRGLSGPPHVQLCYASRARRRPAIPQ
jgi:hypothetical protein